MKTRNGFISNSSSSSFVLIVGKTVYDNEFKNLPPFEKDLISYASKTVDIDGKEVVVIEGCYGDGGNTFDNYDIGDGNTNYKKDSDIAEEETDDYDEILTDFVSKVRKNTKHYYHTQSY